jgi:site-specific recombinase XerD
MFLFKRGAIYQIEYFDEQENRIRRISTNCRIKQDALKFLSNFKDEQKSKTRLKFISLKRFKDEYITFVKATLSNGYYKNVVYSFKLLTERFGNDIPLKKINAIRVETLLIERFSKAKYATSLALRALKSSFNKAIEWNYLDVNPFIRIKLPKIPKPHPTFIYEDELHKIIEKETQVDFKDIYSFAFHTGCRISEILNMRWTNVDFEHRMITVKNDETFTTKSKKDRVVPINKKLLKVLRRRIPIIRSIDNSDYIFEKTKRVIYRADTISKCFKKAVRAAKLNEKIHIHTLRHSFASNLVKKNVSLYVVKELLGHQDIRTTQIYAHLTIDSLRSAVKVLEG